MNTTLISADENEFQPLGIAGPASYLKHVGIDVSLIDLTKQNINTGEVVENSDLIAFSVPIFAAIEKTVEMARDLRASGSRSPFIFYNQYATVQPRSFFLDENCFVIMGEFEEALVEIALQVREGKSIKNVENVWNGEATLPERRLKRTFFLPPDRRALPDLGMYALNKNNVVIGNIETMRGCAHGCTYCSVFAAYQKRVVKIPDDVIHAEIDEVVRLGAGHITFIDADHFSTGKRGVEIIRTMKERHPQLSFDITARLDDIIRYKPIIAELRELGCTEITTAVEFPKDLVLEKFVKKITMTQTLEAIRYCKQIGMRLRPTFVTYSPWINREDLQKFEDFIREEMLEDELEPLQRETRLLLYKGSPLLESGAVDHLELQEREYYYEWFHPDYAVEEAFEKAQTPSANGRKKRCCVKG